MKRSSRSLVPMIALAVLGGLSPAPALAAPAPTAVPLVTKTVALRKPSKLSSQWSRIQKLTYGTSASKLGTSPGGDNLRWGPDYGVQVPDKTWWYADAAKLRLAHYSDSGRYLGQVKLPKKYLAQGVYFQWANPMALSDGTVVLTSTTIDAPALLKLSPAHKLSRVTLPTFVNLVSVDKKLLYGFDEDDHVVRVDPKAGTVKTVGTLKGQGGRAFNLSVGSGYVSVTRPGLKLRLDLVAPDYPGLTVHPSVEATMSANGRLWILITGVVEVGVDEAHDVIGLLNVDADGNVSAVSRVRTPTSDADPGDGHHLGLRYGGTHPTLMFIDTDAARVYRKK